MLGGQPDFLTINSMTPVRPQVSWMIFSQSRKIPSQMSKKQPVKRRFILGTQLMEVNRCFR